MTNLKENLLLLKDLSRLLVTHTSHEALERKAELSPLEAAMPRSASKGLLNFHGTFREKVSGVMFKQH